MKKSEIETIINATPDAVFTTNVKYQGVFIISGFVKESRTRYGAESWYALTQSVHFSEKTQTTSISTYVQKMPLRNIADAFSTSVAKYNAYKIERFNDSAKAQIVRAQNIDAMNEIKPQLARALKALNIDNKASNFGNEQKFTIQLDVDNAEALLALLNTIAAEQVK